MGTYSSSISRFCFCVFSGLGVRLALVTGLGLGVGGEVFLETRGRTPVLRSGGCWNGLRPSCRSNQLQLRSYRPSTVDESQCLGITMHMTYMYEWLMSTRISDDPDV